MFRWLYPSDLEIIPKTPSELVVLGGLRSPCEGRMSSDHSKTNSPVSSANFVCPGHSNPRLPGEARPSWSTIHLTVAGNHKAGFDDVLYVIKQVKKSDTSDTHYLLINTLPVTDQDNLIPHTLSYQLEEGTINEIIADYKRDPAHYTIIVYGKHGADDSVDKKYKQLVGLGFSNTFIYYGGMFEWMLLQDVYGADHFPTTKSGIKEPLRYAPRRKF